jgi:NADH-quinone oxidoreductase subunit G
MTEVVGEAQLGVFGRGSHEVVDISPQYGRLESNYSGNIVELCPVGALLNRDFRFKARSWFLSASPTVCTGCSRGCSTYADFMGQDVYRYRPRDNEAVNKSWMCDQGRLSYKRLNQHRLTTSMLGRGVDAREAKPGEAARYVAMKLKPFLGQVGVVISPAFSNEDLLAVMTLVRDGLQMNHVYVSGLANGEADALLMTADKNPNRRGLEWISKAFGVEQRSFESFTSGVEKGDVKLALVLGAEFPVREGDLARLAERLEFLALASRSGTTLAQHAHALLATSTHVEDEGTFTQVDGLTQRVRRAFPPQGDAQPLWKWALGLALELGVSAQASSSRDVFKLMAASVPELSGFEWDKNAPINQLRPGISSMPAASDGRPPGWREQGAPNLKGLSLKSGTTP